MPRFSTVFCDKACELNFCQNLLDSRLPTSPQHSMQGAMRLPPLSPLAFVLHSQVFLIPINPMNPKPWIPWITGAYPPEDPRPEVLRKTPLSPPCTPKFILPPEDVPEMFLGSRLSPPKRAA